MNMAQQWPAVVKDSCGQFFGTALRAANPPLPKTARVLEIGCAEYDWLTTATESWSEMTFTGIDWRAYKKTPPRTTIIKGDVLTHAFEKRSFDWVCLISSLEHIGLGHYDLDPADPDGDTKTINRIWKWLVPGGWLYFDVPYNHRYEVVKTSHRIYDDAAVESRLRQGRWRGHWRGVVGKGETSRLLTKTPPLGGGEAFYYLGCWWQKAE
jgi:hypothetical protein